MHKTFAGMVEKARAPEGDLDLDVLGAQVMAALAANRRAGGLSRMRMEATVDVTGQAISIFDRDSRLVYCNQHFLNLYRLPKRLGRPGTSFEQNLRGRLFVPA